MDLSVTHCVVERAPWDARRSLLWTEEEWGQRAAFLPQCIPGPPGNTWQSLLAKGAGSIGPPWGSPLCFPGDTQLPGLLGGHSKAPVLSASNSFWPAVAALYMFAVFINIISSGFNLVPPLGVLSL